MGQREQKDAFLYFPELGPKGIKLFDPDAEAQRYIEAEKNLEKLHEAITEIVRPYEDLFYLTAHELYDHRLSHGRFWFERLRDLWPLGNYTLGFGIKKRYGSLDASQSWQALKVARKRRAISVKEARYLVAEEKDYESQVVAILKSVFTAGKLTKLSLEWPSDCEQELQLLLNGYNLPTAGVAAREDGSLRDEVIQPAGSATLVVQGNPSLTYDLHKYSFGYGFMFDYTATFPQTARQFEFDRLSNSFNVISSPQERLKWRKHVKSPEVDVLSTEEYLKLLKTLLGVIPASHF